MQQQNRKLSTIINQPLLSQILSVTPTRVNSIKSMTTPVRIHLNVPGEESRFDIGHISFSPSAVTIKNNKLSTNIPNSLSTHLDGGQRAARFSSVSSSYTQFIKQRDMGKAKKIVSISHLFKGVISIDFLSMIKVN
jgi:hypothetical protein